MGKYKTAKPFPGFTIHLYGLKDALKGDEENPKGDNTLKFAGCYRPKDFQPLARLSGYRRWLTEMIFFHCHSATTAALEFHRCQLILTDVQCIHFRSAAKTAFGLVITGIAQMSRFICNRTAVLTCICHDTPPFFC